MLCNEYIQRLLTTYTINTEIYKPDLYRIKAHTYKMSQKLACQYLSSESK